MNILFLSLTSYDSINESNIYTDLLRKFIENGHKVYGVCPVQRRQNIPTTLITEENAKILKVKTGNITRVNVIEKGISTLLIGRQFIGAIKKYFKGVKFDLILYPTPPITLESVVKYFKKRDKAKTYLLLKDIFPQNAVDIGMMRVSGVKGILYKWFRRKEKKLYAHSDRIGCMSQANVDYVLKHNTEVSADKVEICPNSIEVRDMSISGEERVEIRTKYDIPLDKKVFIYGGNLGKPQGIPFMVECLKHCCNISDVIFIIIGSGTEKKRIEAFVEEERPQNVRLMERLPKEDYDKLVAACDVGLIFLDHRFTIPNFPSRLLAYMQAKVPVFACTDPNTDVGKVITEGGFGWWCESNDAEKFSELVNYALDADLKAMGQNGFEYLKENYTSEKSYNIIAKWM